MKIKYFNNIEKFLVESKEITATWLGVDTETYPDPKFKSIKDAALIPHYADIRIISFCDGINIYVLDLFGQEYFQVRLLQEFIYSKKMVAHNAVFDMCQLRANYDMHDIALHCCMLMGILSDRAETVRYPVVPKKTYTLQALVKRHLGKDISKELQSSDWGAAELTKEQIRYAGHDAAYALRLAENLIPKIKKYKLAKAYSIFKDAQLPVCDMQLYGMYLNREVHGKLIKIWQKNSFIYRNICKKHFGDINFNSSAQLNEWFKTQIKKSEKFKELADEWPKTKGSTDKKPVYCFSHADIGIYSHLPWVKALQTYKKNDKLLSTYGESLQEKINLITDRVHSSYKIAEPRTGRLASSNPNLQNMPRDVKDNKELSLRTIFTPQRPDKFTLIVADYSQIELRIAAELSRDPVMLDAYRTGKDLHRIMAQKITGKKEVSDDERFFAKRVNFGFLYGMGWKKFIKTVSADYGYVIEEELAKKAFKAFHTLFAGFSHWAKQQRSYVEHTAGGIVRTPAGQLRKLHPKEMFTKPVNNPIQGGAAEVMNRGVTRIRIAVASYRSRIINQVHDEIIQETPLEFVQTVMKITEEEMIKGLTDIFPKAITNNLVSIHSGNSWSAAK